MGSEGHSVVERPGCLGGVARLCEHVAICAPNQGIRRILVHQRCDVRRPHPPCVDACEDLVEAAESQTAKRTLRSRPEEIRSHGEGRNQQRQGNQNDAHKVTRLPVHAKFRNRTACASREVRWLRDGQSACPLRTVRGLPPPPQSKPSPAH